MRPGGARRNFGALYTAPLTIWFTAFFVVPLLIIVLYSFLTQKTAGGVKWVFSLEGYARLLSPGLAKVTFNTLWVSGVSTIFTIFLALPCGYYMAKSSNKTGLLVLVIIPFWTNFIIRVIAWKRILDDSGIINSFLLSLGLIKEPLPLFGNYFAIFLINVYMYLPYAILPIYSSIEKFDFALLEAARDLGATKPQSMLRILIPNVKSGIITSVFFTFIPLLGSFVVQQIAGNKDMYMLGNFITDSVKLGNYPFASAIAVVLMALTGVGIFFYLRSGRKPEAHVIADEDRPSASFRLGNGKAAAK